MDVYSIFVGLFSILTNSHSGLQIKIQMASYYRVKWQNKYTQWLGLVTALLSFRTARMHQLRDCGAFVDAGRVGSAFEYMATCIQLS